MSVFKTIWKSMVGRTIVYAIIWTLALLGIGFLIGKII